MLPIHRARAVAALVSFALLSSVTASATASAAVDALADVRRADRALQAAAAAPKRASATAATLATLDVNGAPALKRDAVHALATRVAARGTDPLPGARLADVDYAVRDGADGATCARPLRLAAAHAWRAHVDPDDGASAAWLVWQAPAAGLHLVSTRGSTVDTTLEVRARCADAPARTADDTYGLAAELVLDAAYAGQRFLIRAGSTDTRPGTVRVVSMPVGRTVAGRVTLASNGTPLGGVSVNVFEFVNGQDVFAGNTTTDANGNYVVGVWSSSTAAITLRVRTSPSDNQLDVVHEAWNDVPCLGAGFVTFADCLGAPTPIVSPNGPTTGIDFALAKGQQVAGRVAEPDGQPLPAGSGAQVVLYRNGLAVRSGPTDPVGRFRYFGLPAGTYTATASAFGFVTRVWESVDCPNEPCDVAAGAPIVLGDGVPASLDFRLRPRPHLVVAATLDGQPLDGDRLSGLLYEVNGATYGIGFARTSAGTFRSAAIPPGTYRVVVYDDTRSFSRVFGGNHCVDCGAEIASGTPVTVAASAGGVTIAMDLKRRPSLTGRVVDAQSGAAVSGARVRLYLGDWEFRNVPVAADGSYVVPFVESGNFFVLVDAPAHTDRAHPGVACDAGNPAVNCPGATALAFGLATGDRVVDFEVARNGTIRGTLSRLGVPLFSLFGTVALFDGAGQQVASTELTFDGATHTYTIADVPFGAWYVAASNYSDAAQVWPGVDCPSSWVPTGCPFGAAQAVSVPDATPVEGIDFDQLPVGVRVVRVVDTMTAAPIADVSVDAWDAAGRHMGGNRTDANGRVIVDGWYTAQVRVSTDNYKGYVDEVWQDLTCPTGASVFRGGCSLAGGTVIELPAPPNQPEIVFSLLRDRVFDAGFE